MASVVESNTTGVMTALGVIETEWKIIAMASMATVASEAESSTRVTILNYFSK